MARKVRLDLTMDGRVKERLFDYCANRSVSVSQFVEMLVAEELGIWDLLYMRHATKDEAKRLPCGAFACVMTSCGEYPDCEWQGDPSEKLETTKT